MRRASISTTTRGAFTSPNPAALNTEHTSAVMQTMIELLKTLGGNAQLPTICTLVKTIISWHRIVPQFLEKGEPHESTYTE